MPAPPSVHVIITTHTTRHLRPVLLGVAVQRPRPTTVVVSIDNDSEEVRDLCHACAREFDLPVLLAWRPSPGQVRVGQVRNNGVRALSRATNPALPADWLHFLDGDSVMPAGMLAESLRLRAAPPCDLLIGGRIELSEAQTALFNEAALALGARPTLPTPAQHAAVRSRHRRYVRQLWLKPLRLVKAHKPKVLGANHACTLAMFQKIDGYDETYLGAWREDDDFGRRIHLAGGRARVAVRTMCVFHLWHPANPKKRENWSELPARSSGDRPWLPRAGLSSPAPQDEPRVEFVSGAPAPTART